MAVSRVARVFESHIVFRVLCNIRSVSRVGYWAYIECSPREQGKWTGFFDDSFWAFIYAIRPSLHPFTITLPRTLTGNSCFGYVACPILRGPYSATHTAKSAENANQEMYLLRTQHICTLVLY